MKWTNKSWKDVEEPLMCITKWKKSILKNYILYGSNSIAFLEKAEL